MNKQFLIQYNQYNDIKIFEITSERKLNLLFEIKENNEITSIEFNPSVDNIILVSYSNGHCKIFNLLNKNEKDYILFEGINNSKIISSKFNYFNSNIIASLNKDSSIVIWSVKQFSLIQIIENKDNNKIIDFKWNPFSEHLIEIETENQEIQLINIETKNIIAKYKDYNYSDFLFLNQNSLLLFDTLSILIIDLKENKTKSKINFNSMYIVNKDLFPYNYLIIISQANELYIYDIISFSCVKKINFEIKCQYFFFYPLKDKISCYYFDTNKKKIIDNTIIDLNQKIEINKNINLDNIKNNFYIKYEKVISKYISLLNFKENMKEDELFYEKNYMKIDDVNQFFNKVKKINIFTRKENVYYILNNIKDKELEEELSINNFKEITKFANSNNIKDIKQRKEEILNILKSINESSQIKKLYIEITKLLSIDNTNDDLLRIYLLCLKLYENKLIEDLKEDCIEKYENEVKYYTPCFSKEDYRELFNIIKKSEKELVLNFINNAYDIKKYDYNNEDLKRLIENLDVNFPKFNQPLEFDSPNDELKWHLIKVHIFSKFKNLKLVEEEQENLGRLKKGLFSLKKNKLLEEENIIKDKLKLETSVYLITNPCNAKDSSNLFICNLLLSEKNTIKNLEKKLNIEIKNIKEPLKYKDIVYKDCENLCLNNLDETNNDFAKEDKYNFYYLIDNFEKKHIKIRKFLKKIMNKQTFKDAYNILFGDNNYKLSDPKYLDEFINKRLKFIPTRAFSTLAISDKISLNTFIFIKNRNIISPNELNPSILDSLREILNIGCYVLTEEHEIFHLLDCIPYYENNCAISRNTPRKRYYDGKKEGGEYLELLLFDKIFFELHLDEVFYILDENNYDKTLIEFKEDFKNLDSKNLKIHGEFDKFNDLLDKNESSSIKFQFNEVLINLKETNLKMSDFKIKFYLDNDVAGRI